MGITYTTPSVIGKNLCQSSVILLHWIPRFNKVTGLALSVIQFSRMDGWMNQAYSRLSTTHGDITDCKLLVCMNWTRLVLVRPAASLYSANPLKHHPTDKQ